MQAFLFRLEVVFLRSAAAVNELSALSGRPVKVKALEEGHAVAGVGTLTAAVTALTQPTAADALIAADGGNRQHGIDDVLRWRRVDIRLIQGKGGKNEKCSKFIFAMIE